MRCFHKHILYYYYYCAAAAHTLTVVAPVTARVVTAHCRRRAAIVLVKSRSAVHGFGLFFTILKQGDGTFTVLAEVYP